MSRKNTVADQFAETLAAVGVKPIYCIVGESRMPVLAIAAQSCVVRLTRPAAAIEGAVTNRLGEVCAQAVATFAISYPEET